MIERCRGKKVELLSRQYNHVIGKTVKGFTNLALGWTDSINYVPLLSHLIASNKEKISFRSLIQVTLITELLVLNADS